MPEVQLRLAPVLGAELDMLLAPLILHPQLVQPSRPDDVTGAVLLRHMVNMPGIMQRMGNIRPVRVAFVESNRHLRALDQREVKAVHVAAVGFGETHRHAFLTLPFILSVSVKFHPVQAGRILPGVDIIRFRAGHPRRHGASHLRARQQRRTPAQCFAVGHRQQGHPQRLPAAGGKTGAGD
ncbi:Uncharacterised protein [Klebsiella pneumoniae]|nr:Uncharacterised protein [Klebsiella pneumoniae]SAT25181.1 Uncharacterised protein [Klebsiella pneumoniae]